jgi:hypothetical protein
MNLAFIFTPGSFGKIAGYWLEDLGVYWSIWPFIKLPLGISILSIQNICSLYVVCWHVHVAAIETISSLILFDLRISHVMLITLLVAILES